MTDYELSCLVAEAMGREYVPGESWDEGAGWEPVHSNNDAFEVMVKLRLNLDRSELGRTTAFNHLLGVHITVFDQDEEVATRMAICKAAAQVAVMRRRAQNVTS